MQSALRLGSGLRTPRTQRMGATSIISSSAWSTHPLSGGACHEAQQRHNFYRLGLWTELSSKR